MTTGQYIGVDLGGTKFSMGKVENGKVLEQTKEEISNSSSKEEILAVLTTKLDSLISPEVKGIGIGVPGIVDQKTGVIYDIQNIPAWKEVPLQELLEQRYRIPVSLNNDANCFALGEKLFGKGKAYHNFVGLSIGTGLGMGVIIDDRLYSGVMCGAGEIGMLPYKSGIIEEYAGSFLFQREYNESAKNLHDKALQGDARALEAFQEFGNHLGEAVKIILFMYAPEAIILGGSISKAYRFFENSLWERVNTFDYPKQIEHLTIDVSTHSDLAILGASALCYKNSLL